MTTQSEPEIAITFEPYYKKWQEKISKGPLFSILVSLAVTVVLFTSLLFAIGDHLFIENQWLLPCISGSALLALNYATYSFNDLISKMKKRFESSQLSVLKGEVEANLSDAKLLMYGSVFTLANVAMAAVYGLPNYYNDRISEFVFMINLAIAGFICGTALGGITGIIRSFAAVPIVSQDLFDFTANDRCGGLQFVESRYSSLALSPFGLGSSFLPTSASRTGFIKIGLLLRHFITLGLLCLLSRPLAYCCYLLKTSIKC